MSNSAIDSKKTEDEQERTEILVETVQAMVDSVLVFDLEGKCIFANPQYSEMFGLKQEDFLGRHIMDIPGIENQKPEEIAKFIPLIQEAIKTGRAGPTDMIIVATDGREVSVSIAGGTIKNSEGTPTHVIAAVRDITERKKMEEELVKHRHQLEELVKERTSELVEKNEQLQKEIAERKKVEEELEKYRHRLEELVEERTTELKKANELLQKEIADRKLAEESLAAEKERLSVTLRSIGDAVITTDIDGTIILFNRAAEQLTGWTQEEAVGKLLQEIFQTVNEKTHKVENPVERVLRKGSIVGMDSHAVLISKEGTRKIIAESGAPIRDRMSTIIGVVLVFRDISEQQKMEQELLKTQKLESLGILAGGIAHDFNNILTSILNNVTLARMYTADEKVKVRLTKVEKASLEAKDLTQQLLTFSKGGIPIKKVTSLTDLIRNSASFALRGSNVRCHFYIQDDLWPADADEGQISQVMSNLIINADEAMPQGGIIQVRAENVVIDSESRLPFGSGEYVKVSIRDQGVGVPEKYLSKVFDPYFTTKQKGSGLGLSTCYSIIKQHDGHIEIGSEVGAGTTVNIWLPASRNMLREREEKTGGILRGQGRILLIDDEEIVLDAAEAVLHHLGYEVEVAGDGKEAVTLYQKAQKIGNPFDVAVVDLTIPGGMGGKEIIQNLLEIDPDVKAIVSSGYSDDPVMAHYTEYGFRGVVSKPYTVEELSKVLSTVLEGADFCEE